MSKGKRFSALATATVVALSTAAYFPVATYATNSSCAANPVTIAGNNNNLRTLATDGKYVLSGDTTGDLTLSRSNRPGATDPEVVLDLNGCTLHGRITVNSGTLTIIDSSSDGTGEVDGSGHTYTHAAIQAQGNAQVVIEGGAFTERVTGNNVSIKGGTFLSYDANYVSQHVADGYEAFELNDGRVIVEEELTTDNVSFPDDIEMTEGETTDFVVVVEPESEVLHINYDPVSNEYFEIVNSKIVAKKAGWTEVKITVLQGEDLVAEKTVSVTINPALQWVIINNWDDGSYNDDWQFVYPTGGPCMGYRTLEAGETFELEIETNLDEDEAEISVETHGESWYDNGELEVVKIDEDGNLVAENGGWATIVVTATYNNQTVVAHGHILVEMTEHEIVEGNGAAYDGSLVQKISADYTKLRDVYICPLDAYDKFVEKYGEDGSLWSDEAWAEYDALWELCDTPVDPSNYEVTKGSTVVTFANAWLDTLATGEYEVWYDFTDGYADGTFVIPEKKNEVVVLASSVAVADTGLLTAPVNEGVRNTLGATVAAVMAAMVAAFVTIVAESKVRK